MRLKVKLSRNFRKDFKLAQKRKLNTDILWDVVDTLAARQELPPKHHDHALTGTLSGFRECHIKPDWLLVYRINENELELFLFRTGTHSDIF